MPEEVLKPAPEGTPAPEPTPQSTGLAQYASNEPFSGMDALFMKAAHPNGFGSGLSPYAAQAIAQNPNAFVPNPSAIQGNPSRGGFTYFTNTTPDRPLALQALQGYNPAPSVTQKMMAALVDQMKAPKADPRVQQNISDRFRKDVMQDDWIDNSQRFGASNWANIIATGNIRTPEEEKAFLDHSKKLEVYSALGSMSEKLGKDLDDMKAKRDAGYLIDPHEMDTMNQFYNMQYDTATPTEDLYHKMVSLDKNTQSTENLKKQMEDYLPTNFLLNKSFEVQQAYDDKGNKITGSYNVITTENNPDGTKKTYDFTQDIKNRAEAMWQDRGDELKQYGVKNVDELMERMKYILPHAQEVRMDRAATTNVNINMPDKNPRYFVTAAEAGKKADDEFTKYVDKKPDSVKGMTGQQFVQSLSAKLPPTIYTPAKQSPEDGNAVKWQYKAMDWALNGKVTNPDFSETGFQKYSTISPNGKTFDASTMKVSTTDNKEGIPIQDLFSTAVGTDGKSNKQKYNPQLTLDGVYRTYGDMDDDQQPTKLINSPDEFKKDYGTDKSHPYVMVRYRLSYDGMGDNKPIYTYKFVDANNPNEQSMLNDHFLEAAKARDAINPNVSIPANIAQQQ